MAIFSVLQKLPVFPKWANKSGNNDSKNSYAIKWGILSPKKTFLHAGANSRKLKVISMILGWAWSKMGLAI